MRQAPDVGSFYLSSGSEWGIRLVILDVGAFRWILRFPGCWVSERTGSSAVFILEVGSQSLVPAPSALPGIYFLQ